MIKVALVGIGGYGNSYVSTLLDAPDRDRFHLLAAADPSPTSCRRLADLRAAGVALYPSADELYDRHAPDLVMLSTPLHLHARQTCQALSRGCHVLCEKPLCVTPGETREMTQARDAAGKLVAIGYQWSFSRTIQNLKADILAGRLGAPRRMRCVVLWPRDSTYYARNRWAGAKVDAAGNLVLDSPVNNACAHYLHNLLYLLGPRVDRSADPVSLTAELYRAHSIENYDTAALRAHVADGTEILFIASHATAVRRGPIFSCEFDAATVTYVDGPGATVVAQFADGTVRDYGSPNDDRYAKVWQTLEAVRTGGATVCGIEAAAAHVQCAWAAQQSMPDVTPFPGDTLRRETREQSQFTWVEGLDEVLTQCYQRGQLPSERQVAWSRAGREIAIGADVAPAPAVRS